MACTHCWYAKLSVGARRPSHFSKTFGTLPTSGGFSIILNWNLCQTCISTVTSARRRSTWSSASPSTHATSDSTCPLCIKKFSSLRPLVILQQQSPYPFLSSLKPDEPRKIIKKTICIFSNIPKKYPFALWKQIYSDNNLKFHLRTMLKHLLT